MISKVRNAIALRTFDCFQTAVEEFAPAGFTRRRKIMDPTAWTALSGSRRRTPGCRVPAFPCKETGGQGRTPHSRPSWIRDRILANRLFACVLRRGEQHGV